MSAGASARQRLLDRLRPHVSDPRVLDAMASVPREQFVAPEQQAEAWHNEPLPIGAGQTISQPLVVARMCELLELTGDERVLDVGTGSGYHAALLGRLARRVWSVERHAELAEQARASLAAAEVQNVSVILGDGREGHAASAPYDAINVAAAADREVPPSLEAQLAPGGRLVIPVGRETQHLVLVRRLRRGALQREELERVRFVPLV